MKKQILFSKIILVLIIFFGIFVGYNIIKLQGGWHGFARFLKTTITAVEVNVAIK